MCEFCEIFEHIIDFYLFYDNIINALIINALIICYGGLVLNIKKENIFHNIICSFIKIDSKHRKAIEEQASKFGIHRSQHRMLMYLSNQNNDITQKEISQSLEISPAAVTATLKKLENAELIYRESIKEDNRSNRIIISDKGRKIVEQSRKSFMNIDILTFAGLSSDELSKLKELLDKIENNLNERNY